MADGKGDMCTNGKRGHAAGVDAFLTGSRLPVIVRLQLVVHARECSVAPETPRVPGRPPDKLSGDDCLEVRAPYLAAVSSSVTACNYEVPWPCSVRSLAATPLSHIAGHVDFITVISELRHGVGSDDADGSFFPIPSGHTLRLVRRRSNLGRTVVRWNRDSTALAVPA